MGVLGPPKPYGFSEIHQSGKDAFGSDVVSSLSLLSDTTFEAGIQGLEAIVEGTYALDKNVTERFVERVKDRTDCFDDYLPCVKKGRDKRDYWNLLKLFIVHIHETADLFRILSLMSREWHS